MNLEVLKIGGSWWTTAALAALLVGALLVWITSRHQIARFLREVAAELQKCSWPWDPQQEGFKKYKELIDSTVVVVVSTILLAAFVTFWDFILVKVVGFLTRFQS